MNRIFTYRDAIKDRSHLSVRIVVAVLLCSSLLTLLATAFQLYFDYRKDVKSIHSNITFIKESYLPAIISSIYALDMEQVEVLLEGSLNIIDIEYIVIEDSSKGLFKSVGNPTVKRDVTKTFPLHYTTPSGRTISLGTLKIFASLEGIYSRLVEKGLVILFSNMVKTFFAAILFLVIINHLVIRHLRKISNFINNQELLRLDQKFQELTLDRKVSESPKPDELDRVVFSLNHMQAKIHDDILKLTQAGEDLRERENELQNLLQTIQAGVVVHDVQKNKVKKLNQTALNILGLEEEQLLEKNTAEPEWGFISEKGEPLTVDRYPVNIVKETRKPLDDYIIGITNPSKNEPTWVIIKANPQFNQSGELAEIIISSMDITELKNAQDLIREKNDQLLQAQKMEAIGTLAGGVAHDFNNMLGVILGYTEMVLEEIDPASQLYTHLHSVHQAGERSAALTRQLLAFARKQTIAPRIIDVNDTVEKMIKMLRRLIGENIELLWHPGRNLKPVKVDPSQLDQLLVNLCVNARDAIDGVGKIIIETDAKIFDEDYCSGHRWALPGEYVLLKISDDGCGMDKDTLNHIFEPFFTTKGQGKGTGMGLASIYGIVKQNKGFINVYSEPGHGTTFKIYLPVVQSEGMVENATALPIKRGNETILLVEDESAILKMTTTMLERLGYNVLAATTPGEAIRLAHEHQGGIDLLMTDVVMPEMNGQELAVNLLSYYPDLKSLFMSGYTANIIAFHGVLDKGVHFIQKPFSKKVLGVKLREALED